MSWLFRRFLLFLIIIIFFIASPLIVYYAKGYRFDFQNFEFTKTGTISIKTIPRNAAIFINAERYPNNSPTKIDSLKPKQYRIQITKEGYLPWEADLSVKPELVTSVTHVILLPDDLEEESLIHGNILNFSFSLDKEKIIYNLRGKDQGIYLKDLKGGAITKISDVYFDEFSWSSDNKKVILTRESEEKGGENRYAYLDLTGLEDPGSEFKIWDIGSLFSDPIEDVRWQPGNSNRVFLIQNQDLYEVNIEELAVSLLRKNIYGYTLTGGGSLYVQKQRNGYFLISEDYRISKSKKILCRVTEKDIYKIILGSKKLAFIAGEDLYIILDEIPMKISSGVKNATWSPNGKRLLYFNEHQIAIYHLREKESSLLTRDSRKLTNIGWWPRSQYVIYSVDGKIKLIDGAKEMDSHMIAEIKNTQLSKTRIDWSEDTKRLYCLSQVKPNLNSLLKINMIKD